VEDRLEQLSEACLWARSAEQVTAGLDAAYELLVEAQAVFLRYLRQADLLRAGSREAASSTSVWLRTGTGRASGPPTGGCRSPSGSIAPRRWSARVSHPVP
jgi:hypothetical protein